MYRRTFLSLAALSFALPAAAQFSNKEFAAASKDPKAFTIDETTMEIIKVGETVSPVEAPSPGAGICDAAPSLDAIVNLGLKFWKIVEDNKPVVDVKTQYASALPEGAGSWMRMSGWQRPKGTIYQLTAKNAYGIRVINLRYQVVRTAGGNYKGKGKYLTAVTVAPLLVEVAWGYRFSLEASIPDSSVVNVGTGENPVAAMLAVLGWRISTPIKDASGKGIYYLQGDGVYQEIGGPFKRGGAEKMKAAIAETMRETLPSGT